MKHTPSRRSPRSHADTTPQEIAAGGDLTKLTGATITDAIIRGLLEEARKDDERRIVAACLKALVHPKTRTTERAVSERLKARETCADEINKRATWWLTHKLPLPYEKYARLLQRLHENGTAEPGCPELPQRRRSRRRTLKYTHCWYCNDPFEYGNYTEAQAHSGPVLVHRACLGFVRHLLVDEGDAGDAPDARRREG